MAIEVRHSPDPALLGLLAFQGGRGQYRRWYDEFQQRERMQQEALAAQREGQERALAAQEAAQRRGLEANRESQAAAYENQRLLAEQAPARQAELNELQIKQADALEEGRFTREQQRKLMQLDQAEQWVKAAPELSDAERVEALRAITMERHGLKPMPKRQESPWPKGQDVGDVWQSDDGAHVLTRDKDGNVKKLAEVPRVTNKDVVDAYKAAYDSLVTESEDGPVKPKPEEVMARAREILKLQQELAGEQQAETTGKLSPQAAQVAEVLQGMDPAVLPPRDRQAYQALQAAIQSGRPVSPAMIAAAQKLTAVAQGAAAMEQAVGLLSAVRPERLPTQAKKVWAQIMNAVEAGEVLPPEAMNVLQQMVEMSNAK